MSEMHIYLFSPIRYDFLHQRPQKLADQFRSMSIPVTFIQPSGFKEYISGKHRGLAGVIVMSVWYHLLGIIALILPFAFSGRRTPTSSQSDFEIISLPVTYPVNRVNSPVLESLTSSIYRQFLLRRVLPPYEAGSVAVFIDPFWGNVIRTGDVQTLCYDCIDDLSLYAGHASLERFEGYEEMLLDAADCIVVTSGKLEENLRLRTSKKIVRVPNGVDFDWFQTQSLVPVPKEMKHIPHPIVGYVGHIAGWMDYELIRSSAALLPEVSFVFIGPFELEERVHQLRQGKNIYLLGRKPYAEIPSCINMFDVCMIPFIGGPIAQTTNPVKIFEYFALGKPVVSTPLNELQSYVDNGLMKFAASPELFVTAIQDSLAEKDTEVFLERKTVAGKNSWQFHARSILETFHQTAKN